MIEKISKYYKECRVQLKKLNKISIKGSNYLKSFIFSILLTVIILIPFMIIAYNIFSLYDPSTITFKIMLLLSILAIMLFNGLASCLNVILLKNYFPDHQDLKSINNKDIFFVEFFNPYMIVFSIALLVFIIVTT